MKVDTVNVKLAGAEITAMFHVIQVFMVLDAKKVCFEVNYDSQFRFYGLYYDGPAFMP